MSRFRTLGVARSARATRLLRDLRLYAPLHMLYAGASEKDRDHWADSRAFRRRYGKLLGGIRHPEPPVGRVLLPHVSPGPFRIQIEGMLAKALEARGWEPLFVLNRHDPWHEEYTRGFGFRDFVFIEDYWPDKAEHTGLARELLAACEGPLDVIGLEYHGVEVGRHTASKVLKSLRRGTIELGDPEIRRRLEWGLVFSLRSVIAAEKIYDEYRPEKLIISEKGYSPWGEFTDIALHRDVDVLHWYRSQLEHRLMFRRYRWHDRYGHFFSLTDETWEDVKAMPWSEEDGEQLQADMKLSYVTGTWFQRKSTLKGKRIKAVDEIRADLGLDPGKKTAFLFAHILDDATYWFGENLFLDYAEWELETIGAAIANPHVNWVIKMHPENVKNSRNREGAYRLEDLEEYRRISERYPELPDHVRLMTPENDTNTVSLFDFADYAVTVRGTVGMEFPCFGVSTFTAGTGGYSGRGFTTDSATAAEYLGRLARIHEVPPLDRARVELAQRFAYGVFYLKPMPIESFTWTRESELFRYFTINAGTAAELAAAPDLNAFADWAEDPARPPDLIDPAHATFATEAALDYMDPLSIIDAEEAAR